MNTYENPSLAKIGSSLIVATALYFIPTLSNPVYADGCGVDLRGVKELPTKKDSNNQFLPRKRPYEIIKARRSNESAYINLNKLTNGKFRIHGNIETDSMKAFEEILKELKLQGYIVSELFCQGTSVYVDIDDINDVLKLARIIAEKLNREIDLKDLKNWLIDPKLDFKSETDI